MVGARRTSCRSVSSSNSSCCCRKLSLGSMLPEMAQLVVAQTEARLQRVERGCYVVRVAQRDPLRQPQHHLAQLLLTQPQAVLQRVERWRDVALVREGEERGDGPHRLA